MYGNQLNTLITRPKEALKKASVKGDESGEVMDRQVEAVKLFGDLIAPLGAFKCKTDSDDFNVLHSFANELKGIFSSEACNEESFNAWSTSYKKAINLMLISMVQNIKSISTTDKQFSNKIKSEERRKVEI